MDEIVKEFLIESSENLDRLDQELVRLEADPSSKELLASIFRTIHTIKGSCGFLGFPRLEKLAHAGEGLLARLRDGELAFNEGITSALLALVDAVRGILSSIRTSGQDGDRDFTELIDRLAALQQPPATETQLPASPHASHLAEDAPPQRSDMVALQAAPETIRVGVNVLDRLMNLVGELVLVRNRLRQSHPEESQEGFLTAAQRLNLITGDLQSEVMQARMQPISTVWNKFPRTVRDLAVACAKDVRLEMQGEEVELDRTILEAIRDPLVHLVRNAIDHGIEAPGVRQQAGKKPGGALTLRAFHESGRVKVEVSDDGAGLNRERICQKAMERGLLSADQAANLPDRDAFQLVFRPGFSTAERVTSVSGRGVGMDVVKTNVEAIGGMVDVHSVPGQGTTFTISIPLTLAIIPALIVRSGGERFAIPQASLVELVRLDAGKKKIENIHGTPVYRLRGRLLPLLSLNRELKIGDSNSCRVDDDSAVSIVVVCAEKNEFGLIVDEITDTQEIVVKPIDRQLKLGVYAGTTILGDGRVALILDIHRLAQHARLTSQSVLDLREDARPDTNGNHGEAVLIVQSPDHCFKAIPLSAVWRLEEVPRSAVEKVGSQEVIQYEGDILPLIRLGESDAATAALAADVPLSVVVCRDGERKAGLVVERFIDIVEDTLLDRPVVTASGVLRAAVVQQHVTELLDAPQLVREQPGSSENRGKQQELNVMAKRFCTFTVDGQLFGTPVAHVWEVITDPELTQIPLAESAVSGVTNLRGQIVLAIDLRRRLGIPDRTGGPGPIHVVLDVCGAIISLIADEIGEILEVADELCEPPSDAVPLSLRSFVSGIYKLPDRLLLALDVNRVTCLDDSMAPQ